MKPALPLKPTGKDPHHTQGSIWTLCRDAIILSFHDVNISPNKPFTPDGNLTSCLLWNQTQDPLNFWIFCSVASESLHLLSLVSTDLSGTLFFPYHLLLPPFPGNFPRWGRIELTVEKSSKQADCGHSVLCPGSKHVHDEVHNLPISKSEQWVHDCLSIFQQYITFSLYDFLFLMLPAFAITTISIKIPPFHRDRIHNPHSLYS